MHPQKNGQEDVVLTVSHFHSTIVMMAFMLYRLWVVGAAVIFVVCALFFVSVCVAESMVRITEIMYDADGSDIGREFVEVVNVGSEAVDMTTVKFFERDDRHTGRAITQGRGGTMLRPGDAALIVANPELFSGHYPLFDGVLLDTGNFALLNAGATVSLQQSGRLLHSVTYTIQHGAKGDGHSLHINQDESISAASPTPGEARDVNVVATGQEEVGNEAPPPSGEEDDDDLAVGVVTEEGAALIVEPSVVFSASTTVFSVAMQKTTEDGDAQKLYGLWNFGDGNYTYGDTVEHAYLHPGAYIIVFQELGEDGSEGVVLQQKISVLFPQVSIERVDDVFVRLHNRHPFVLDVSGWKIVSGSFDGPVFLFPDNSLVPAQSSTVVSFPSHLNGRLLFVTSGGGQFSGERVTPSVPQPKSEKDVVVGEEERAVAQQKEAPRAVVRAIEDSEQEQPNIEIAGKRDAPLVYEYSDNQTDESDSSADIRMIIVWLVLLVGIMAIALVPLLFARSERKKHPRS